MPLSHFVHPGFSISGDPVFVAATQGMPLDHLSLETRGLYSCVLQDCNNQREFLQVYHSQGTVHVAD